MAAGRAEAARAAHRFAKLLDLIPFGQRHCRRYQLGDAFTAPDREGFAAMVDHDDLELAAIIAVDRAGRVRDGDAVLERQPERGRLDLIAFRDGDLETGGPRDAGRVSGQVLRSDHVHPRCAMGA